MAFDDGAGSDAGDELAGAAGGVTSAGGAAPAAGAGVGAGAGAGATAAKGCEASRRAPVFGGTVFFAFATCGRGTGVASAETGTK